nr:hypothetical protein [Tanacetum cinerariifolium]
MLATGRYLQWRSRFLRYIDTRSNDDALRKCILSGAYKPTTVLVQAVAATDDSPAIPKHTTVETPMNMSPKNKAHFQAEKEAIHLILTGTGDEIHSTVDACQTAQEMWKAIKRLQQGESLNIQDLKTNLFWEFRKFTSHDGETMESYYTRFYKLMNEMIRNNLIVATMQVNVQFLQQLQPEWSRFVTIMKQQHKLDEVSYHKLFDILKQYQKEVNELHAERLARNANPLALVATAQANQDPYYQTSESHKSYAPSSKPSIPTRTHTTTIYKGKEIAKPITPPSETTFEEDNDPEHAQRDKDMQKNLALIAKYFKKIYKPTNNNLRTSLNLRNKNVDTTPRYKNDNQSGQFGNQKTVNVVGTRENVGSPVVQQYGIQCFNCKEFGHFAKECRKPKRVKDFAYHKEKMLLCKQAEKVEMDDRNVIPDSPDMCDDDIQNDQNDVESDDERVALANLITNLKIDTEFEKYKAFNDRTVNYDKLERKLNETLGQLAQKDIEIKEGLKTKAYEILVVKEKHDELIKQSLLTKSHYEGLVKQKTKVITNLKLREEHDIDKMLSMEKQLKFLNEIIYKRSQSIKTIHMMAPIVPTYNGRPTFANPRYLKQAQSEIPCLYAFLYDQSTHANRLIPDGEETLALERESRSKNKDLVRPYDYTTLNSLYEISKLPTQEFEIHLNFRTSNVNAVCGTCGKCLVDSNHFACVTKMLNDVNFRTNKPNVVPISTRKPKGHTNKSVATPHKKKVASKPTNQKPQSYFRMLYEKTSKTWKWWIEQQNPSGYKWVPKTKMQWVPKAKNENVQKSVSFAVDNASRITNFAPILGYEDLVQGNITINRVYYGEGLNHNLFSVGQFCDADLEVAFWKSTWIVKDLQGNDLLTNAHVPSQQEFDLLCGPLYDEFFNAEEEHLPDNEFTNPFCVPTQEAVASSSHNIGNSNVPTFNQPQVFKYRWTKDHPLEQVRGNPSRPVQTR